MRAAAIQMNSGADVEENLRHCEEYIATAVDADAELVVLPENFAIMPRDEAHRMQAAEADGDGPIQSFLAQQARIHGIWMIGGTIPLSSDSAKRFYAACMVYNPRGERVARYDKLHLFDVAVSETEWYRESEHMLHGSLENNLTCVDVPGGCLGLTICYDLRFPELYRTLVGDGATIFTVPSAFTATTGRVHWETLLRARAIENLAYVIAPAQSGRHVNGRSTYGHSMIIDPWGTILDQATDELSACVVGDIDPQAVNTIRERFPCLQHRRLQSHD